MATSTLLNIGVSVTAIVGVRLGWLVGVAAAASGVGWMGLLVWQAMRIRTAVANPKTKKQFRVDSLVRHETLPLGDEHPHFSIPASIPAEKQEIGLSVFFFLAGWL
ncbi:hypothetical protein [Candidatus Leptofilum sp.]|uniref:hypothetical protein n=1 Tax=Candidatus Leptofilum sp. TaxID=3241576 RepID=UPI003B5B7A38